MLRPDLGGHVRNVNLGAVEPDEVSSTGMYICHEALWGSHRNAAPPVLAGIQVSGSQPARGTNSTSCVSLIDRANESTAHEALCRHPVNERVVRGRCMHEKNDHLEAEPTGWLRSTTLFPHCIHRSIPKNKRARIRVLTHVVEGSQVIDELPLVRVRGNLEVRDTEQEISCKIFHVNVDISASPSKTKKKSVLAVKQLAFAKT